MSNNKCLDSLLDSSIRFCDRVLLLCIQVQTRLKCKSKLVNSRYLLPTGCLRSSEIALRDTVAGIFFGSTQ